MTNLHEVEYIEPMDSRDAMRAEIAHFLDHGALKPGSCIERLKYVLAPHASGRPGPAHRPRTSARPHQCAGLAYTLPTRLNASFWQAMTD